MTRNDIREILELITFQKVWILMVPHHRNCNIWKSIIPTIGKGIVPETSFPCCHFIGFRSGNTWITIVFRIPFNPFRKCMDSKCFWSRRVHGSQMFFERLPINVCFLSKHILFGFRQKTTCKQTVPRTEKYMDPYCFERFPKDACLGNKHFWDPNKSAILDLLRKSERNLNPQCPW